MAKWHILADNNGISETKLFLNIEVPFIVNLLFEQFSGSHSIWLNTAKDLDTPENCLVSASNVFRSWWKNFAETAHPCATCCQSTPA